MTMQRHARAERATDFAVASEPAIVAPVAAPVGIMPAPLAVGRVDDAAESDADRMADTALRRLSTLPRAFGSDAEPRRRPLGNEYLRRTAARAGGTAVGRAGGALDPELSATINGQRSGGRPLEPGVRTRMQTAFSRDFSRVRIHDDAPAASLSRMVSARAFTTGQDVFFGEGEYQPTSASGERVLAHELAHTVQQSETVARLVRRKPESADYGPALRSVSRTLRLLRDHRFGSADRERAKIPAVSTFGSRSASHSTMGLAALEQAKEAAKKVGTSLTKKKITPVDVATQMADCAGTVYDAFEQAKGTIEPEYNGDLARIGAKAVNALGVGLTSEVLRAEPQVQKIFGRGGAEYRHMIARGKGRLNKLIRDGDLETSGFHGTSSPILASLAAGDRELLSMKELSGKNIPQATGEGDTLSAAAGLKDDISIGMGVAGLGTSATYAALGMKSTHYNTTLFTYEELVKEIDKLKTLAELASYDFSKLKDDEITAAAQKLGVPAGSLASMIVRISPASAASLKKRLDDELKFRDKLDEGDPRREGGRTNAATFPILFEFGIDRSGAVTGQEGTVKAEAGGTLPGEGVVKSRIPLATTLKRAWCPAAHVDKLTAQLKSMFEELTVEVLPLEALQALPRKQGAGGEVLWSTFNKMKGEADKMETARDLLATAMKG